MGYVYLAIALILLGGGGYGAWTYTSAVEKAERLEEEAKAGGERERALRETINLMDDAVRKGQKLSIDRANRANKAEEEAGRFRRELEELKNAEQPVKEWATEPIPPTIRRLRGEGAFTDSATVLAADGKPKLNPDPGSDR